MKALKRDRNPIPLQLLIKEMPGGTLVIYCIVEVGLIWLCEALFQYFAITTFSTDLAEYVLNKCITQSQPEHQISISGEDFVDSPIVTGDQPVHYNFHSLEDSDEKLSHNYHGNHILDWMVSQDGEGILL